MVCLHFHGRLSFPFSFFSLELATRDHRPVIVTEVDDASSGGHVRQPMAGGYGQPMAGSYAAVTAPQKSTGLAISLATS